MDRINFDSLSKEEKYQWYKKNKCDLFNILWNSIENQYNKEECLENINNLLSEDKLYLDAVTASNDTLAQTKEE